jgi:BirA family biotin operon repressor/biotin-[acetyl-CoA-carboxylase] ligase
MKSKILQILKSDKQALSGERLGAALGVSRVSISKHIQKLRGLGYDIPATKKGYMLSSSPDTPFPWEFPERESKIHYYPEVTSTMDIAKNLARDGCDDFTVVIADRQNKGRGRLNRTWISSDGGLYFTIILRPKIPISISSRISFAASLTLARTIRKEFNIKAMVKWPNDILVDERKISGMLSEMDAEAGQVNFINIGIGLNVNNDPSDYEPQASSLKKILGYHVSRNELLANYLNEFENRLKQADHDSVVSEWKKYTLTLNRRVKIVTKQEVTEGLAVDVDKDGALILKADDGALKKIRYGDCFHQD